MNEDGTTTAWYAVCRTVVDKDGKMVDIRLLEHGSPEQAKAAKLVRRGRHDLAERLLERAIPKVSRCRGSEGPFEEPFEGWRCRLCGGTVCAWEARLPLDRKIPAPDTYSSAHGENSGRTKP